MSETSVTENLEDTTPQGSFSKEVAPAEEWLKLPSVPSAEPTRLPKRIAGGFKGLGDDLDRRGREWTATVRLLEQHRLTLEAAEQERAGLAEQLARVLPEVQESGRALKTTLDACKSGDISGDLAAHFTKNARALEDLEKVAAGMNANLAWVRSLWEQYARNVIKAQRQREDLRQSSQ